MTLNVTITNNSSKVLTLGLLNFFTQVTGHQTITLQPSDVHECQADGCDADVQMKVFLYCQDQGVAVGSEGLQVKMSDILPEQGE